MAELGYPQVSALDVFMNIAREHGQAVAIRYFDGSITYDELNRMSDAFAAVLTDGGIRSGDRVALFQQNTPHFVIANLGAWKAGATVVPFNPMNRERELHLLLNDCMPRALVLSPDLYDDVYLRLPRQTFRPDLLFTSSPLDFQTRNDTRIFAATLKIGAAGVADFLTVVRENIDRRVEPLSLAGEDTAYIVYTSGTTGIPKGAKILHRNVLAGIGILEAAFEFAPVPTILGLAPLFHVTGLMSQINMAIAMHGVLVLTYRFEPSVMVEAVRENQVTNMSGAITAFIAMMHAPGANPADMTSIRSLGSGGAPTPPALVSPVEKFFGVKMQIGYGLTETCTATHVTPQGQEIPIDPSTGAQSVGVACAGVDSWIEGPGGQAQPPGEAGEIVISSPALTAGYWRKPTDTAEVYRIDGFRTGDIGFQDEHGWLYLIDRKKDMISASGFKVWPREVEDVLYTHPAVREAAVVGVPDSYRGESVRAVVSLKPGASVEVEELQDFCRQRMAAYKYPREIKIVDELPKTVSGKILRRLLKGTDLMSK